MIVHKLRESGECSKTLIDAPFIESLLDNLQNLDLVSPQNPANVKCQAIKVKLWYFIDNVSYANKPLWLVVDSVSVNQYHFFALAKWNRYYRNLRVKT